MFKKFTHKFTFSLHATNNTHWKIAVMLFFVLFLVVAGAGFYLFVGVNNGELFTVQNAQVVSTDNFDTKSLSKVVEMFDARKADFEKFKTSDVISVDPSL